MRIFLLLVRKIVVPLVGFPVVGIGIILLPLPGPGLLVILAGLLILSMEYEWAKRHHRRLRTIIRKSVKRLNSKSHKILLPLSGAAVASAKYLTS